MGLDMYLEVETYFSRPMDWMKPEAKSECAPSYNTLLGLLPGKPSDDSYGISVSYTVAYWRKANAIHKWFVDNVQNGVDNCQRSWVSIDQLNELLSVCHEVVKAASLIDGHVADGAHSGTDSEGNFVWVDDYKEGKVIEAPEIIEKLLPTESGFFFGSTGYDQYYLEDVKNTITQLQGILAQYQGKRVDFHYQASW